jgi:agmatinase
MKLFPRQFLGLEPLFSNWERAAAAILPFPYEGGVSYGLGSAKAPEAVIDASFYLELYDEALDAEPYRMGISTLMPPNIPEDHQDMFDTVYETTILAHQQ